MVKKLFGFLIVILILITPKSTFAATGEYFIDSLNIDAQILSNGDVEVNETIQYRFEGNFNGIYRNLNLVGTNNYKISEVSIIDENGNVTAAKKSD